jgi:hypothetical protein
MSGVPSFWYESLILFNSSEIDKIDKIDKIDEKKNIGRYIFGSTLPGIPSFLMARTNNLTYGITYGKLNLNLNFLNLNFFY